ncbi:MAG: DegT/DnrJ/EryC1/StrS family aminotransferase [Candidatus Hydrogenedentes bacterium]|nr:DegT/DnrJ/EryC1/StrS family aminotransferase [Candidatus Hydrogenedentota bacterium]
MKIGHSAPTIGHEEREAAARVLASGRLAQGAEVAAFEAECAAVTGRAYGVATSSGTAALHLALEALGCTRQSRVALPTYGCVSLATAVDLAGGQPVLCEVGHDFNLDPAAVPVDCHSVILAHLFGARAQMPDNKRVIEDIAQSIGGPTGGDSIVAVASFYATKLITAGGEGGMVLTDDSGIAEYVRDRRDYDNRDSYVRRYNYKLTEVQAAVGRVQLRRLPEFIERRRSIAARYEEALRGYPLRLPSGDGHVYFRYVVQTPRRDELERALNEKGIEAKRPVYLPAHRYLGGHFPVADEVHERCLSLPIYPSLTDDAVTFIIDGVKRCFS